ncbi:MAG: CBS domain-containing protein [Clostridiales bacterium]|jgi:CBS domain-containing protein|nr:CBS domain-containing protein [Clostridiales bacterium]
MNIAHFLVPKQNVAFLYNDFTLRQGLEKLRNNGYSAIPVLTRANEYVGTVSEGDFLWNLIDSQKNRELKKINIKNMEGIMVSEILQKDTNSPVRITATIEELMLKALDYNFIPVIDDRNMFIGIITRRDIIRHFIDKKDKLPA